MEKVVAELASRGRFLVAEPFFEPGTPVTIDRRAAGDAQVGDLVTLTETRGRGRVERVLGDAAHIEPVLEGLLWHEGVRHDDRPQPDATSPSDEGRVDLRHLFAFTVDPEEAKDFDDAISVERTDAGLRVWIHIADVAAYVSAGSALDQDALERSFSVYVPGGVEPMIAPVLSDDLCSLVPNRDRRCVTVEIPIGSDFEPAEPSFYRSLIRNRRRLTYGEAESILTNSADVDAELTTALRLADEFASQLRQRRYTRGALSLESQEVEFEFDGMGGIERAWIDSEARAHMLIEEHMILANELVAQYLSQHRAETLYRVHERPDAQSIELLLGKFEDLDVPTPPAPEHLTGGETARVAAEASILLRRYVEQASRGRVAFPSLLLRSLKQAHYDSRNLGHSGLASRAYCHFTSPIRRYPDLVCHRALLQDLGAELASGVDELDETAIWTSERERRAITIERNADDLCLVWFLERRLFETGWDRKFEGEIIGVIDSGLFVRFDELFEGFLPARRLSGDYFQSNSLGTALIGRRTQQVFRLGDPVNVTVEEIRRSEGKVNLALCEKK